MEKAIFENGILKIPTKNGYLVITPTCESDYPGVYIDLYTDDLDNAKGVGDKNTVQLALIEQSIDNNYYTKVWDNQINEDMSHNIKHQIFYK